MLLIRGLGRRAVGVIGIIMLLVGVAAAAHAAPLEQSPPFALPAKELLALKSADAPKSGDVEVLLFDAHWDFDAQGKLKESFRYVYRIRTQRGAEGWASTAMSFHPWHQKPARIRARVVTPDGSEHVLDPKTLVESAANGTGGATYSDQRRLSGPLPAVRPGAVVEEWLEVGEHRPYFDAGQVTRIAVAPHAHTALWRLTVTGPTRLPMRYRLRGSRKKPAKKEAKGKRSWVFEYRDVLPVYQWPKAPPDPEQPLVPTIEVASGQSWQAVAQAYHSAVEAQLAGCPSAIRTAWP